MNRERNLLGRLTAAGLLVWLTGITGCGKVPTWNELTNKPQPQQQSAPNVIQSPSAEQLSTPTVIKTPDEPPMPPDPEKVIAEFKKIPPSRVDNSSLTMLTTLEDGIDLVTEIDATGGGVTNEGLSALPKLTSLKVLRLEGTKVNDEGCQAIGQLPSLEELSLTGGMITDIGIEFLRDLTQLKILKLANTQLTQYGWEIVGQLPALEEILIDHSSLNDDSAFALSEAAALQKIDIRYTNISDEGLKHLAKLNSLVWLDVGECQMIDGHLLGAFVKNNKKKAKLLHLGVFGCMRLDERGVTAIAGMDSLEELAVGKLQGMTNAHLAKMVKGKKNLRYVNFSSNPALTNDALSALTSLKDLEYIDLSQNPAINDQALIHLTKLKNLKTLNYGGSGVTAVGIEMLRKYNPDMNRQAVGAKSKADAAKAQEPETEF